MSASKQGMITPTPPRGASGDVWRHFWLSQWSNRDAGYYGKEQRFSSTLYSTQHNLRSEEFSGRKTLECRESETMI